MTGPRMTSGEQALVLCFLLEAGFPVDEATEMIHNGTDLYAAKELAALAKIAEVVS